ncbi:hypothetical protein [Streptomyces sp. MUSC 14]|nr:hypothetical protein [Streptomyces sp. MUSC 14]
MAYRTSDSTDHPARPSGTPAEPHSSSAAAPDTPSSYPLDQQATART